MDFSKMTNDELDEHIAKLRGWKYNAPSKLWVLINNNRVDDMRVNCVPFTTDPRYAMELLKEMPMPHISKGVDFWRVIPDVDAPDEYMIVACHIDLFRAISEAYAQWKGEK